MALALVSGDATTGAALLAGPKALAPEPQALLVSAVMAVGPEADGDGWGLRAAPYDGELAPEGELRVTGEWTRERRGQGKTCRWVGTLPALGGGRRSGRLGTPLEGVDPWAAFWKVGG